MLTLPSSYKQILFLLNDSNRQQPLQLQAHYQILLGLFFYQIQCETMSLDLLQCLKWPEVQTQNFRISLQWTSI
jgi:hypothetical protein